VSFRLSSEQQLVAACLPPAFGRPGIPVPKRPCDWDLAVELASSQGLVRLFGAGATALSLPIPTSVQTRLRIQRLAADARTRAFVEPLLKQVVGGLVSRGFQPIVLKGAALSYLSYPSSADRSFGDIDVLLPADQVEEAGAFLLAQGFWNRESDPLVRHHLRPYYSNDNPLSVELHFELLAEPGQIKVDLAGARSRARPARLGDVEAQVLSPVDALMLTCAHLAASHRFSFYPLRTMTDVLAITSRCAEAPDWELFLDLVCRAGAKGAMFWPLHLSRLWLGADIPARVVDALAPPAPVRRAVGLLAESGFMLDLHRAGANETLLRLVRTCILHAGFSNARLLPELLREIFPPLEGVASTAGPARSKLGHAAYLARPERIVRSVRSARRLAASIWRTRASE
jgi:hypothetical protein